MEKTKQNIENKNKEEELEQELRKTNNWLMITTGALVGVGTYMLGKRVGYMNGWNGAMAAMKLAVDSYDKGKGVELPKEEV